MDAKRLSAAPGGHAWMAFKLRGEWLLCDVSWVAGSVS